MRTLRCLPRTRALRRAGWTLPELLVMLFIISILLAMLLVAIQKTREAANRSACAHNLKQLALAAHSCNETTGALPPYSTGQPGTAIFGGWWIHLLPYMSESAFYDELLGASDHSFTAEGSLSQMRTMQPRFRSRRFAQLTCASDPSFGMFARTGGTSNYLANWFLFADPHYGCYSPPQKLRSVEQGHSNTVLFAEGYSSCNNLVREALVACGTHNFGITWHGKPSDDPSYLPENYMLFQTMPSVKGGCSNLRAQTPHASMPVAFADGSVRFIESSIAPDAWSKLMKGRE